MKIIQITAIPTGLMSLVVESEIEGFRFLTRFVEDFKTSKNTFSKEGEALFIATENNKIIAIGGMNQQKETESVGRVRRFYVSKDYRKFGVGKKLLIHIENHAFQYFDSLVLFTDTKAASDFYIKCGYQLVDEHKITHVKFKPD